MLKEQQAAPQGGGLFYGRVVSEIDITLAAHADLSRLLEIRHAAFSGQTPAFYNEEEVRNLLEDVDPHELAAMIEAKQLFVARRGKAIIGLAGWKDDRVRHVYVEPNSVRAGVVRRC